MKDLLQVIVVGIVLLAAFVIVWTIIGVIGIMIPHWALIIFTVLAAAIFGIWALKLLFKQAG